MIRCKRRVVREMAEVDSRTGQPIVLILEEGGRLVKVRAKGTRTTYTITVKEIWLQGAKNAAAELKRLKLEKRKQRATARE